MYRLQAISGTMNLATNGDNWGGRRPAASFGIMFPDGSPEWIKNLLIRHLSQYNVSITAT
jgi:hypothetical protein